MQPYTRSPDLVWPGHLHGTGCLSARAMDAGFPTVVCCLCLGLGCAWAPVSAAPRHSWLGCWGVCALVCALRLYPATPGWAVRCGCVCLGSGFGCAPPPLARVLGRACLCARSACTPPFLAGVCGVGVCAWAGVSAAPRHSWLGCWGVRVRAPLVPRHSWLGCASWVCVLWLGFRLHPATPSSGVGVCVCSCARSACTPPLLAGVCSVGVCAWARVSAAPRQSWLGCWGVRLRAPLLTRHSWLGCMAWVCVVGLGFQLRPASPGWGVGVCLCWCACSACTPPLLARVCVMGVCAWAWVLAAPRLSWLGCWAVRVCVLAPLVPRHTWLGCAVWVCVLELGFRLRRATPGWGVGVCVCSCACPPCPPRLLVVWCVCIWVWVLSAARFFLAWVLGRVALCMRRVRFPSPSGAGACDVGVCGSCRGWGLSPPSPFVFFLLSGCGGGVWFSALLCRGFVVSAAASPGLGSLGLRPPFPCRLGCA